MGGTMNGNGGSARNNIFAPASNALLSQQQQQQQRSGTTTPQQSLQYSASNNGGAIYAVTTPNVQNVQSATGQTVQNVQSAQAQRTQTPSQVNQVNQQQQQYYAYRAGNSGAQYAIATNSGQQVAQNAQYMANYGQVAGPTCYLAQNGNGGYVIANGGNQQGTSYVMDNLTGSIYAAVAAAPNYGGNQQYMMSNGQQLQTQYMMPQQLMSNGQQVIVAHPQQTSPAAGGTMSTPPNVNVVDK